MAAHSSDVEYVEVGLEEFLSGKSIPYDIYIRLSATKYVKLANQGDDLTPDRLEKYKDKKISALFLRKDDYLKYVGMKAPEAPPAPVAAPGTEAQQIQELLHLGDLTLEIVFFNEMNEIVFGTAKNFVDTTVSLLTSGKHALGLLAPLNGMANFIFAHGVAVSAYGVMIAHEMGWKNSPTIFKVAVGGLLHDIGKRDIDRKLLLKPKSMLTTAELEVLETHCAKGVKILESVPSVPSDVIDIVLQHHEHMDGSGYPNKLDRVRIHPMARVVGLANAFCDLVLRGPDGPGLKPWQAISQLSGARFDPEAMAALKRLFKVT